MEILESDREFPGGVTMTPVLLPVGLQTNDVGLLSRYWD